MTRPRLGIDADGVILNNDLVWAAYFNDGERMAEHGHAHEHNANPPTWEYMLEICKKCSSVCFADPDLLAQSDPMPGALAVIPRLAEMADLHLISHRNPELTPVGVDWLKRHDILQCFTTYEWSWTPKKITCERLGADYLLDDGPANIKALAGSSTIPVIFTHPYNLHLPGIRVDSWDEFLEILQYAYAA